MEVARLAGTRPYIGTVRRMVDEIDRASATHELRVFPRDGAVVHHEVVARDPAHRQSVLAGRELDDGTLKEHGHPRLLAKARAREEECGFLELPHRFVELDLVLLA